MISTNSTYLSRNGMYFYWNYTATNDSVSKIIIIIIIIIIMIITIVSFSQASLRPFRSSRFA